MVTMSTKIIVLILVVVVVLLTIAISKFIRALGEVVYGTTFCRDNPQFCKRAEFRRIIPNIPTQVFSKDFNRYLMLTVNVVEGLYASMSKSPPQIQFYKPQNAENVHLIENNQYPYLALFCEMNNRAFLFVRGTNSVADAETDVNYQQIENSSGNLVHKGFYDLYMNVIKPDLDKLKLTWSKYDSIFIAGHSLGASAAIVAASEIQATNKIPEPKLHCLAIAPPRTGSPQFASRQMNQNFIILINLADFIPDLPLSVMSTLGSVYFYQHGGNIITFSHNNQDLQLNHSAYMYLDHFVPPPSSSGVPTLKPTSSPPPSTTSHSSRPTTSSSHPSRFLSHAPFIA